MNYNHKLLSLLNRLVTVLKGIIIPPSRIGRGAILGAIAASMALTMYFVAGIYFQGSLAGIIWGFLAGLAAVLTGAVVSVLAYGIFKLLSTRVTSGFIGAIAGFLVVLAIFGYFALIVGVSALAVIPLGTVLGAAIAGVICPRFWNGSTIRKVVSLFSLTLVLGITVVGSIWYADAGTAAHLVDWDQPLGNQLNLPDPSLPGSYQVATLYYGSGTDIRRPEYGPDVNIVTKSVDVTPFVPQLSGFRTKLRDQYWGFSLAESPINGRVWYPVGEGPFPLVLIVHGNHEMSDFSDPGYAYLGELLASRGYIVASVDQNYMNISMFGGDLGGKAIAGRGWLLLEHLSVWRQWQDDEANLFFGKVDLDNIALIGHSRGGEAVAVAAALNKLSHYPDDATIRFDYNFGIKSVLAFAPTDEFFTPAGRSISLEDINYLVVQGGHDGDVSVFMGSRQYQRTEFSGDDYYFKSVLYIYQANHGQFNTGWGEFDMPAPFGKLLNVKALMPGEEQLQVAKVYVSAFLDATLGEERGYLSLFRDFRSGADWLPNTIILNRFQDSATHYISNFEEDLDPGSTTVAGGKQQGGNLSKWKEGPLTLRMESMLQANNVAFLDWDRDQMAGEASFRVTLPESLAQEWLLDSRDILRFSLADLGQGRDPLEDMTVILEAADGTSATILLSQVDPLVPPLQIKYTKLGFIEGMLVKPVEPVLQTCEIPLSEFVQANPEFDPAHLTGIEFQFNSSKGSIALDDIGFRNPGE